VIAHLSIGPEDVGHTQVDIGCKPAVELHLALAGQPAQLLRREVEEICGYRLLQLIGTIPGEDK
jgi:hypothetical protein